ncbi:MAG: LPS export ABC transporter periplasmic protein LptC [Bacteroidales bacterium]|nr:LPS export ABC transporter periplasmic protein LptC [Bacteroidales bacterium]
MWIHVLVYVSISFLFFSCTDRKTKPEKIDFNKKPVQVMQNILLYRSDKGEVYARLEAKTVQYYSGDSAKTVFPDGIKVLIYNKDMSDKSLLTANYAINYTSSSDLVYIKDSVKIINFNTQDTIYCRDLYWNQDAKTVYSHNPIRRYTQGGETFGDGMTANEQFDSVVVIRPHGKESFSEEE